MRSIDNTYFSQQARAETTFVIRNRFVIRANADYNNYRGITDPFLEERLICNVLLGVKLFRNRLGEISVGVNDLLDQNSTTFQRSVTGTTLRYVTNLAVGRYVAFQASPTTSRVYKRTGIPGLTTPDRLPELLRERSAAGYRPTPRPVGLRAHLQAEALRPSATPPPESKIHRAALPLSSARWT